MILLKGGTIVNPEIRLKNVRCLSGAYDVLLDGDRVHSLFPAGDSYEIPPECTVVDATGLFICPGLVDVHSHFRDPGQTAKEDIHTGSLAAAAGGYTSIIMMANTKPPVDSPEILREVLKKAALEKIHVYASACVTEGMQGKKMTNMSELSELGAVGFTDDGVPVLDERIQWEALRLSSRLKKPISVHEEDPRWIKQSGVNAGAVAEAIGLQGADREAEVSMVERDLNILRQTGGILNLQHISARESVNLIRQAKKKGLKVHAEATPHHFSLTEQAVLSARTLAKMNPPLRTEEDRMVIIEGIADGTLDLIATDHAPHTREEKDRPFTEAPSGIIGLETAFALAYTNLVLPGHVKLSRVIECMSTNPSELYHLPGGLIKEGGTADLMLFDPQEEYCPTTFYSKAQNTQFAGYKLKGRVKMTIVGGEIVFDER